MIEPIPPSYESPQETPNHLPMTMSKTNLWLIEDHTDLRDTLKELFEAEGRYRLRTFSNLEAGIAEMDAAKSDADQPDVMILDIGLPGMSGLEGISEFKTRQPNLRVLIFTVFDDRKRIFEAICAGASGYLLKMEDPQRIVAAVAEVERGGWPMTPEIAGHVLERFSRLGPAKSDIIISDREQEVLTLIVDGKSRKEIAGDLEISIHTVDSYVRRIYDKLHVKTLGGAVAKALREGLV